MNECSQNFFRINLDMRYIDWIAQNWNAAGGLVTQAQAAKMLRKTPTRIRQMVNERKLTPYQYESDAPLISFSEVIKLANCQKPEAE